MQGDVALRRTSEIKSEETVKDKVLAWGEISGHAHVITGDAEVFNLNGKMFVVVGGDGAKLEHMKFSSKQEADHGPIVLQPNQTYEVLLQNEYNPFDKVFERVID